MKLIDDVLLDELTLKAKSSLRLRASYDLRTTIEDQSQRILNALEPGTVVPIHRHTKSTETVVLLRGRVKQYIYSGEGVLENTYVIDADSASKGYIIPVGQWHTTECLVSGTVLFESKDGAYEPLAEEDIMSISNPNIRSL